MISTKQTKFVAVFLLMYPQMSLAPKIKITPAETACYYALKSKDFSLAKQYIERDDICLAKPLKHKYTLLHHVVLSQNEALIQLVFEKAGVRDKETLLELHSYQNFQNVSPLHSLKLLSKLIKLENPIIKQYVAWIKEDAIRQETQKIINLVKENMIEKLEKQLTKTDPAVLTEIIEPKSKSLLLHWVLSTRNSTAVSALFRYAITNCQCALHVKNSFQLSPFEMMAMLATNNTSTLQSYIEELQNIESE